MSNTTRTNSKNLTDTEPDPVSLDQLVPAFMAAPANLREQALDLLLGKAEAVDLNPDPHDPFLTQRQVAALLAVHPITVRRWRLPCHRFGRVPRYRRSEVLAYLAQPAFLAHLRKLKSERVR